MQARNLQLRGAVVAGALALVVAFGYSPVQAQTTDGPVFAPDIAVILQENCQVCHQLYGFGGFLGPIGYLFGC